MTKIISHCSVKDLKAAKVSTIVVCNGKKAIVAAESSVCPDEESNTKRSKCT